MYAIDNFTDDDHDVILGLASILTGSKVNKRDHSVILHNVAMRILEHGLKNLDEYLYYVDKHIYEKYQLISALTIHTTSWFREPGGLDKFEQYLKTIDADAKTIRVLSVGCSTGEEVYSIASILENYKASHKNFQYSVEGWDIDPISLKKAIKGEYNPTLVEKVPDEYQKYIFHKEGHVAKIKDSVKDNIKFRTVNIIHPPNLSNCYDYIFCRNMLIYFDVTSTTIITEYLTNLLSYGGCLCVGLSETIAIDNKVMTSIGSATYTISHAMNKKISRAEPFKTVPRVSEERILWVDPDIKNSKIIKAMFEKNKMRLDTAANGDEACYIASLGNTSIIVAEHRLRNESGLSLCKSIRKRGYEGAYILLSDNPNTSLTQAALEAKVDEVILKPVSDNELLRLVKSYRHKNVENVITRLPRNFRPRPKLILLGASTGGVDVLVKFLKDMPKDCPPIMIVQHIGHSYASDYGRRLANISGLSLANIKENMILEKGTIYIARGDYHIGVVQDELRRVRLITSKEHAISGHRPSIDFLFQTAAKTQLPVFAVIFTGMGRDGAQGLLELKENKARTYAQDEKSSIVYGMPKEAVALGAAEKVLPPEKIREELNQALKVTFN